MDMFIYFSNINLPVLPPGLQILADQGFEHNPPVLVLPRANQQPVPAILRQYVTCTLNYQVNIHATMDCSYFIHNVINFFNDCRTFRTRRALIERCFGILKNSYSAVGTRRFRSRRWHGPLICNVTAALYNRRKRIFQDMRTASGHLYRN